MNSRTIVWMALGGLVASLAVREARAQRSTVPPSTSSTPARSVANVVQRNPSVTLPQPNGTACVGVQGCPTPREIPVCTSLPERVLTLQQLWANRLSWQRQRLTVRTRLAPMVSITEVGCPANHCCNSADGAITFPPISSAQGTLLHLGDEQDPAYRCHGDDSGYCCNTAVPTGDVLVTGVLAPVPGTHGHFRLEAPTVCRVP